MLIFHKIALILFTSSFSHTVKNWADILHVQNTFFFLLRMRGKSQHVHWWLTKEPVPFDFCTAQCFLFVWSINVIKIAKPRCLSSKMKEKKLNSQSGDWFVVAVLFFSHIQSLGCHRSFIDSCYNVRKTFITKKHPDTTTIPSLVNCWCCTLKIIT